MILVQTPTAETVLSGQTEIARSSSDNFFDLRLHAHRQIGANLAQNYRRLCVVSVVSPGVDHSGFIQNLTPERKISLPEHFEVVKRWLGNESRNVISEATKQLEVQLRTKIDLYRSKQTQMLA